MRDLLTFPLSNLKNKAFYSLDEKKECGVCVRCTVLNYSINLSIFSTRSRVLSMVMSYEIVFIRNNDTPLYNYETNTSVCLPFLNASSTKDCFTYALRLVSLSGIKSITPSPPLSIRSLRDESINSKVFYRIVCRFGRQLKCLINSPADRIIR